MLAEIDADEGMPDGLAVDGEGAIWVALFGGGKLHRYGPDGVLQERIPVPVRYPTSVAFAGPDLTDLVVTSAYAHIVDAGEKPSDLDGAVLVTASGTAGCCPPPCATSFTS